MGRWRSMVPALAAGGAHGRVTADPQRRHARRQPRDLLARRRRSARAQRARCRWSSWRRRRSASRCPSTSSWSGSSARRLAPGELIVSVTVPVVDGWQGYAKVGVRNAMVIAVASACVVLDRVAATGGGRARIGRADDPALPRGRSRNSPQRSTGRRSTSTRRRARSLRRAGVGGQPPDHATTDRPPTTDAMPSGCSLGGWSGGHRAAEVAA